VAKTALQRNSTDFLREVFLQCSHVVFLCVLAPGSGPCLFLLVVGLSSVSCAGIRRQSAPPRLMPPRLACTTVSAALASRNCLRPCRRKYSETRTERYTPHPHGDGLHGLFPHLPEHAAMSAVSDRGRLLMLLADHQADHHHEQKRLTVRRVPRACPSRSTERKGPAARTMQEIRRTRRSVRHGPGQMPQACCWNEKAPELARK